MRKLKYNRIETLRSNDLAGYHVCQLGSYGFIVWFLVLFQLELPS
jgi:hypothetical protein